MANRVRDPWRTLIDAIAEHPNLEARRRMAAELYDQRDADAMDRLAAWIEVSLRLDAKTDAEVAKIVREALWDREPIGSPASELLHQVIARLCRAGGGTLPVPDEEA